MRLLAILIAGMIQAADPELAMDTSRVLRSGAGHALGINLNWLRDADADRAAQALPLQQALRDLGVRWLRYPGGEKSDFHRFAAPPYTAPAPQALGWYAGVAGSRIDFDRYRALCASLGAEPYVVVACDSPQRTGSDWDEQLRHAAAWVRHARSAPGPRVRHWEIGNENWHNGTAAPEEMAAIVTRFSRAMKAEDPEILIGASGNDRRWWSGFLPAAAADLDFLSVSVYNCWAWRSYDRFLRAPEPDLLASASVALDAIADLADPAARQRMRVIVAETNSVDYSEGGWNRSNDLGHAIVTFESLAAMLHQPRIAAAMLWTTRWVEDDEARRDQFYALDASNRPTASGLAVALWGAHLRSDLVAITGATGQLRAYASVDAGHATVWLVNRGPEAIPRIRLRMPGCAQAHLRSLTGNGPLDTAPVLGTAAPMPMADGVIQLTCPPTSISIVTAIRAATSP